MVAVIVPISPGNRTEGVTVKSAIITLGFSASTGRGNQDQDQGQTGEETGNSSHEITILRKAFLNNRQAD